MFCGLASEYLSVCQRVHNHRFVFQLLGMVSIIASPPLFDGLEVNARRQRCHAKEHAALDTGLTKRHSLGFQQGVGVNGYGLPVPIDSGSSRGDAGIRTRVQGFADPCLATRPRRHDERRPQGRLIGADDRDRTGDLNLGKVALYQLSYVRTRVMVTRA